MSKPTITPLGKKRKKAVSPTMARQKNEAVTVTFHYLRRMRRSGDGERHFVKFGASEFKAIVDAANKMPKIDLTKEKEVDKLRYRNVVIFNKVELHSDRIIVGTYRNGYWGHAFDNTIKGLISADSVNLRPFHFIMYLSDDGKIYLGTQYLGLYGGYTALEATIRSLMNDKHEIEPGSYRLAGSAYKNAVPKEVRVTFNGKSKSIASSSNFANRGVITFKKTRSDDNFSEQVSRNLMPFVGKTSSDVKRAVATMLSQGDLMSVDDKDIEDCTVLADVNGQTAVINMIDAGSFPTKFHISVGKDTNGHPLYDQTREAMIKLLTKEVIERNV